MAARAAWMSRPSTRTKTLGTGVFPILTFSAPAITICGSITIAPPSAPIGTAGSQFYVVTAEDAQLPAQDALLGRVTAGMDVVERIAAVETKDEKPVDPIVIESITVSAR